VSAAAIGYPQDGDSHPLSLNPLSADLVRSTSFNEAAARMPRKSAQVVLDDVKFTYLLQ
jgi:hypothetical protein